MFSITAWFSVASEGREHTRYMFEVNMRCFSKIEKEICRECFKLKKKMIKIMSVK